MFQCIMYLYKKQHKYFKDNGIKFLPGVPIFGNNFDSTFKKKHSLDDLQAVYEAFSAER